MKDTHCETLLRYRIISNETEITKDWVNRTVCWFRDLADAMVVCRRLPISAYVADSFTGMTYERS